jgi:hypothetical protein
MDAWQPSLGEILFGSRVGLSIPPGAELSSAFSAWYWTTRAQGAGRRDAHTRPDCRTETVAPFPHPPMGGRPS